MKDANYAEITLKNGKKTITQKGAAKMSGKKLTFTLLAVPTGWQRADGFSLGKSSQMTNGKWKVTKIVLREAKKEKRWYNLFEYYYITVVSKKVLATAKVTKPTTFQLIEGKPVTISTSFPKSVKATSDATISATLKSNGKALKNETLEFRFDWGTQKVKTDARGVAEVKVPSSKIANNFSEVPFEVLYKGKAKKYRQGTSGEKEIGITRDKLEIVVTQADIGWNGSSGNLTYKAKVVNANTKAATPNIPVRFRLVASGMGEVEATANTNSAGIATVNMGYAANRWQKDRTATLYVSYTNDFYDNPYYLRGPSYEKPGLATKQTVKYYTLNISKLKVLNDSGLPWGTGGTSGNQQLNSMIYIEADAAFYVDGKLLTIGGKSNGCITVPGGTITKNGTPLTHPPYFSAFSLYYSDGKLVGGTGVQGGNGMAYNVTNANRLTFDPITDLGEFSIKGTNSEYLYKPAPGQVPITIPNYTYVW